MSLVWALVYLAGLQQGLALGTLTSIEQHPSVVQVEHYGGRYWVQQCVGILLTNFHALSAATCLYIVLNNYRIRAGSSIRGVGGVTTGVSYIIKHPSHFESRDIGDIGIIRLRMQMNFGPRIAQAHIMPPGYRLPPNIPLNIVGWGFTVFPEEGGSNDHLYSLQLQTKSFQACEEAYNSYPGPRPSNVTAHMLCLGLPSSSGRDFDTIDRGAPLFLGNVVAAVASFGIASANDEMPLVSTEISHYTSWIVATAV